MLRHGKLPRLAAVALIVVPLLLSLIGDGRAAIEGGPSVHTSGPALVGTIFATLDPDSCNEIDDCQVDATFVGRCKGQAVTLHYYDLTFNGSGFLNVTANDLEGYSIYVTNEIPAACLPPGGASDIVINVAKNLFRVDTTSIADVVMLFLVPASH